MEVIDLGINELEPIQLDISEDRPNVQFNLGADLLMNNKRADSSSKSSIDIEDLNKLENELNELSQDTEKKIHSSSFSGFASNMFGFGNDSGSNTNKQMHEPEVINMDSIPSINEPSIGQATANSFSGFTKTFDGFMKMNDIPAQDKPQNTMNERERRRKKRLMIKKLDEWYEKGIIKNHSHFNMDSSYEEIEDEYESALEDKRLKDSIKLQGWWFMTFVNSLEYANAAFDPFDLNLDGWAEQVSEDLDSYEEIFSELHQKYKGGKLSPELSLLLRLGFSAAVTNFTNKALSTATPGFNDVIKQNPDLMKAFTNATVQSMSQQNPSFQFVNNVLNKEPDINTSFGPPPPPAQTKITPPSQRGDPRPDIQMARAGSSMFFGSASGSGSSMFRESGVDMSQQASTRPEMKGPQNIDINNILSGLKAGEPPQPTQVNTMPTTMSVNENDSIVSGSTVASARNTPKKQPRRKTSERNTISLDI